MLRFADPSSCSFANIEKTLFLQSLTSGNGVKQILVSLQLKHRWKEYYASV